MSTENKIDQDTESSESSGDESSFITTAAGCFAAFTICYALFNLVTGQLGIKFEKDNLYWSLFLAAYLLVNIIFWPIVKKHLR